MGEVEELDRRWWAMILGVIPARGGSKGVPGKNLRNVAGKPLVARAIECGALCVSLDKVIVSTDSTEIAQVAEDAGASVPFIRPADLADDNSSMIEVLRHAVLAVEQAEETQVEAVVLIDPTAPLRKVSDVEGAIALFQEQSCDAVVSANLAARNPYFNMVEEQEGYARLVKGSKKEIIRRQDCPLVYDLNTVVWVFSRWTVLECGERIPPRTVIFEIPAERAVDLDTEEDFRYLSFLMDPHRVETR